MNRTLTTLRDQALILLVALVCWNATSFGADRPNILVYLSDDHSQFDSSLYGNSNIPTPNFEALAADGMTFTQAFVASPSCAPSRAAMLTGLMPARNGAEANHTKPKMGTHSLIQDLQAAGYEVAAFGKVAHGRYAADFGFDHIGPGSAIDQLRATVPKYLQSRQADKPLCLFVGTSNPHVAWTAPSTFDPAAVEFPPHHLDTPATREHRAAYYQEIKDLDALLGELRQLAADSLGENTLFVHTSDHGSQWPFGKWNLYDYGTRVPFIASWPGVIKPGVISEAMISWVDLLPTLIDVVGGDVPQGLDGRSFADVLRGRQDTHRDMIFSTHTGDGIKNIYPIRSVRTRDWKLIHNLHPEFAHTNHSDLDRKPLAGAYWTEWAALAKTDERAREIVDRYFRRPEWELYHVTKDKWELTNLADDPAQADKLAELKGQLSNWMRAQGDKELVHREPRRLDEPARWHPDNFQAHQQPRPGRARRNRQNQSQRNPAPRRTQTAAANNNSRPPNFIVILTDDQGWGTTSALYDPEHPQSKSDFFQTPNLERLLSQGMRFTQAYAAHPNCSPSRAALLTGRSPAALHFTDIVGRNQGALYVGNRLIPPQHINELPSREQTIPELLKQAHPGYVAAHFGKWHLRGGGPEQHGFDASDGATGNAEGTRRENLPDDPKRCFSITRRSIDWMQDQVTRGRPFYLQVSHYATHLGYQSRPATKNRIESTTPGKRHQNVPYAAMIADMDEAIGRLLDAIDAAGIMENTYVIYTADNGTYPTDDAGNINGPLRGSKATIWEAGVRVPFVVTGPGIEAGTLCQQQAVGYDILPTICELAGIQQWPPQVEGGSLVPALRQSGEVKRPRDYLVFHWPHYQHEKLSKPDSTLISGNRKLHYWWEDERVMLFDLDADLAELSDVAGDRPAEAAELKQQLFEYLDEVNAQLPMENPDYDPESDPALARRIE